MFALVLGIVIGACLTLAFVHAYLTIPPRSDRSRVVGSHVTDSFLERLRRAS